MKIVKFQLSKSDLCPHAQNRFWLENTPRALRFMRAKNSVWVSVCERACVCAHTCVYVDVEMRSTLWAFAQLHLIFRERWEGGNIKDLCLWAASTCLGNSVGCQYIDASLCTLGKSLVDANERASFQLKFF